MPSDFRDFFGRLISEKLRENGAETHGFGAKEFITSLMLEKENPFTGPSHSLLLAFGSVEFCFSFVLLDFSETIQTVRVYMV